MNVLKLKELATTQAEKMAKVDLVQSKNLLAGLNCFAPGQAHKPHTHAGQDKLYVVLQGSGLFSLNNEETRLSEGEMLHVPEDASHGVVNDGDTPLVVLAVITPNPLHK